MIITCPGVTVRWHHTSHWFSSYVQCLEIACLSSSADAVWIWVFESSLKIKNKGRHSNYLAFCCSLFKANPWSRFNVLLPKVWSVFDCAFMFSTSDFFNPLMHLCSETPVSTRQQSSSVAPQGERRRVSCSSCFALLSYLLLQCETDYIIILIF